MALLVLAGDCNAQGMGLKLLVLRPFTTLPLGWVASLRSSDVEVSVRANGGQS